MSRGFTHPKILKVCFLMNMCCLRTVYREQKHMVSRVTGSYRVNWSSLFQSEGSDLHHQDVFGASATSTPSVSMKV